MSQPIDRVPGFHLSFKEINLHQNPMEGAQEDDAESVEGSLPTIARESISLVRGLSHLRMWFLSFATPRSDFFGEQKETFFEDEELERVKRTCYELRNELIQNEEGALGEVFSWLEESGIGVHELPVKEVNLENYLLIQGGLSSAKELMGRIEIELIEATEVLKGLDATLEGVQACQRLVEEILHPLQLRRGVIDSGVALLARVLDEGSPRRVRGELAASGSGEFPHNESMSDLGSISGGDLNKLFEGPEEGD